jgi:hypothetical protein
MLKGDFEILTGKIVYSDIELRPQGRLAVKIGIDTKNHSKLYFKCVTDNAHSVIDTLLRITEQAQFRFVDDDGCGRRRLQQGCGKAYEANAAI